MTKKDFIHTLMIIVVDRIKEIEQLLTNLKAVSSSRRHELQIEFTEKTLETNTRLYRLLTGKEYYKYH